MIGRALNGRYELGEILGVGGMATVYRGLDHQLGRPVAVKVLNGGLADDPRFAERFAREARSAALLSHPRIVTVFDSGVDQGSPYLVMELVHGATLGLVLAEQGALPVERAVGIAAAVLDALAAAHAQGLVHRDIKPGNVMITQDGGVKVVDFGIARAGSSSGQQLTQTATVLGTAAYLSPEQATAAPVDGRADLYAVGCVLYEMLAGAPPFTADTPVAVTFKHVTEYPVAVSAHRPDVPPALDAAILRLLAKHPAERPADAPSAAAELLAAVPAAPADRTAELLGAATQVLPPVPAGVFPAAPPPPPRQPWTEQHRTSVLPPVQAPPPLLPSARYEDEEPEPRRGRNPLVYAGIGAAVIACVAGIAAFSLGGGDPAPKAAHTPAPTSAAPVVPTPAASPSPSPSASGKPSASPKPSATPKGGAVVAQLIQLRGEVAQTPFNKDRDKQDDLTRLLDQATQAVNDRQPGDAEGSLKDAQKVVRDLQRRKAVDPATLIGWQARLAALTAAVHAQAAQQQD
ncbi:MULTISPECIES: protein kinase [Kitasatospora]|uniref:non-specific serine/threonine protein kinase n=1 Tax=Kitasatospora setae (strain ATCC 33774 / DSM 43861 / JCM 3304 / KCC A-0304 / NBRC 14216 / KM-6054) TaxID=452652 RepID=E4NDQ4_KITSK|nr:MULTISPECIES: protein kinase [Kitasatospora]BAJ29335.1 putative serine/threonine protein kinase [Kitasatospora setae KM-6054]